MTATQKQIAQRIAESNRKIRNDFLRKVMLRAHAIRRETGAGMSEALKTAWRVERIEELESRIFYMNMADRLGWEGMERLRALNQQLRELKAA